MANDQRYRDRQQQAQPMREGGMPQGQAPANRAPPRETAMQEAARKRSERKREFAEVAIQHRDDIERSLRALGIPFDTFIAALEVGLNQTMKNNEAFFEKVSPQSFLQEVVRAAHLGIMPDGKEGAIVNYGAEAAFMPMVEGFVKLIWGTGMVVDVNQNVVCEGDDFDFEEGDQGYVRHRRSLTRAADAATIGAWCVINLKTGGKLIEVVDQADLRKIAGVSRATKGPRVDWEREMHRKAPFRRIVKRMPKTEGLAALLAADDRHYDLTRSPSAALADGTPAVPTNKLFSGRVAVRGKPRKVIEAPPEHVAEEVLEEVGEAVDHSTVHHAPQVDKVEDFIAILDDMDSAVEFATILSELDEDPTVAELSAEDQEKLHAAVERNRARFLAAAQAGQEAADEFQLQAIISSTEGAKVYGLDHADQWRDDILFKLDALKGDPAKVFWLKNLPFILAARDNGFQLHAGKILDVGARRNLPSEVT